MRFNGEALARLSSYCNTANRIIYLIPPSAAPLIGVATPDEPPKRVASTVALDKAGAPSVSPSSQPTASTSAVVAEYA